MQFLKIKNNINLKQLESLGFEYDGEHYAYYCEDNSYIFIDDLDRDLIIYRVAEINDFAYNEHGEFSIETSIPAIIMVLVKMDFVEII